LMNQRADNTALLNNQIMAVRTDSVLDVEAFPREPGALWPVEFENAITPIPIDPTPSTISLPAEAEYLKDMHNLSLNQPFSSTSEAQRVGADTATEAALVTNIAQRATIAMKLQLVYAYKRIGQQRTELNSQFIRTSTMVERLGLDNEREMVEIAPELLQGGFDFDMQPMAESLMRSEKRAEWNATITTMAQLVPLIAALAQTGNATMLNIDEFVRRWLENLDVGPTEPFFSQQPPAQVPGNPGQGGGAPAPAGPGGVTAPQSIDPVSSPSSPQASLNPASMMQQFLAQSGGANNT
jgi:hypothetical protein